MPLICSVAAVKIGARIRAARERAGVSLADLGDLAGLSWTNIGKIERGASSPTAESLVRIASALDVDPARFLVGITADDYGVRHHRVTARDVIEAREEQRELEERRATAAMRASAEQRDTGSGSRTPRHPAAEQRGAASQGTASRPPAAA